MVDQIEEHLAFFKTDTTTEQKTSPKPPPEDVLPGLRNVAVNEVQQGIHVLTSTNWREHLEHPYNRPTSLQDAVPLLMKAEALQQVDTTYIATYITDTMRTAAVTSREGVERYQQQTERSRADEAIMQQYEDYAQAYEAEVGKMEENTMAAYLWYAEAKETILKAKAEIYATAAEREAVLQQLLEQYRIKPWIGIAERVLVTTPDEYAVLLRTAYGDTASTIERASGTNGYATVPELGKPRAAVVKVGIGDQLVDKAKPEAGIQLQIHSQKAIETMGHEIVHIIGDDTQKAVLEDTAAGKRLRERRGFKTYYYYTEDGVLDTQGFPLAPLPELALDEGAVVLLDLFMQGGQNLDQVITLLENPEARFTFSREYAQVALETAKICREIGIDWLLRNYTYHFPIGWLQAISSKLGFQEQGEYEDTLRRLQEAMLDIRL